jgi:hypothetical protein
MTSTPGDLTAAVAIEQIEAGGYPRETVLMIARGFLPLAQDELISVLAFLAHSPDEETEAAARQSLAEMPGRVLFDHASNSSIEGAHLVRLIDVLSDTLILEALIRNRAVPDSAIAEFARRADERVQEVIVINQARILRAPEILEGLLQNPSLTPDVRRRALETKEEFFEKRARLDQMEAEAAAEEEGELADVPLDPIADLLERAVDLDATEPPAPPVPLAMSEREDPKKAAIWGRIAFMTVSERVQLAYRGDRMVRMLLVRERNKLVCSAVMRNPRISEQEVEAIATMRNVEEEVLRLIGMRRDWTSKYKIIHTLARNPKTPVGVVLPFINRLTLRDLKGLKDDRGVQQVVREMAKKMYLARAQKS